MLRFHKYWQLDPDYQIILDSEEEYIKAFLEIFKDSINCRLRSEFPIGFELSGGLDSSSIISMAKENYNENNIKSTIHSFSLIYDNFPEADESYYINKIIETGGIEPHFVYGDDIDPLKNIEKILWYQDQPFVTPFMTNLWKLYKKMEETNIRIILEGVER